MGAALIRGGLFQLHSLLGLAVGLVLVVLGVTGALYSFQLELLELLNPPPTIATVDQRPLTLPEVRQRLVPPSRETSSTRFAKIGCPRRDERVVAADDQCIKSPNM